MADYLSGLLARSTATSPAVRPRMRGLFEPVSAPGDAAIEVHDDAAPQRDAADHPAPPDPTPVPAGSPAHDEGPRPATREPRRPAAPERRPPETTAAGPAPSPPPSAHSRPPAPADRHTRDTAAPLSPVAPPLLAVMRRRPTAPASDPSVAAGAPRRDTATAPPPAVSAPPAAPTAPPDSRERLRAIAREVLDAAVSPSETGAAPAARPVAPDHERVPTVPAIPVTAPREPPTAAAAPAAPTLVSVTIGRVEVRAAAEPPRPEPRKPRKAAGPSALEEYLSHRNGTRR
jgi:hypothetical protein